MWETLAAPIIGAGASLLGGLMSNEASAKSAERQMEFQRQSNAQAMAFNQAEAQKNRDWQERMSGSAHQREVLDLRMAGLNPILSVNRSGAATGGGAQASGVSSAGASYQAQNPAAGAAASALSAMNLQDVLASIRVKDAQADNIKAQTVTELNRPENVAQDTELKKWSGIESKERGITQKAVYNREQSQADLNLVESVLKKMYGGSKIQAETAAAQAIAALHSASAKSADIKARLDAAYGEAERIIGMGEGATSALRNLVPGANLFRGRK